MINVIIRETQNPAIQKFEFPDFIANHVNYEFKNIDEAAASPLAQKLFHLPFVKAVYISGNFIAIERYNPKKCLPRFMERQLPIPAFLNSL
jgi:hypothetical protein